MVRDECLLFVSGDTAERWPYSPHTAFESARTRPDDPPRRSIEARVFVLLEPDLFGRKGARGGSYTSSKL
eukprot:1867995-Prymnesium_polylepis.1